MPPKKKFPCPNPLFLEWLEEWRKEAEEKGLNSKWTYQKAMTSLKRYPLPLCSGKEAKILENIGDGIAKKLDKRLEEFLRKGGTVEELHFQIEQPAPKRRKKRDKDPENEFTVPKSPNMKSPNRPYIPKYRSGPYAILITLYKESKKPTYLGFLTKIELQTLAQPLCEVSMTVPDPGSHYTAWSSMGTLLKKGLVLKWSSPAKFNITSTGCELAELLLNGHGDASCFGAGNYAGSPTGLPGSSFRSPDSNGGKSFKSPNNHTGNAIRTTKNQKSKVDRSQNEDVLLTNLQNIVNELNSPNPAPNVEKLDRQVSTPSRDVSRSNVMRPGSHFAKLQGALDDKRSQHVSNNQIGTTNAIVNNTKEDSSKLRYWYVTDTGRCTSLKSQALVTIDSELNGVGFLLKTKKRDLKNSGTLYKYDESRNNSNDGYVYAFICDKDANELADTPKEVPSNYTSTKSSTKTVSSTKPKSSSSTYPPNIPSRSASSTTTTATNKKDTRNKPSSSLTTPASLTSHVNLPNISSTTTKKSEDKADFVKDHSCKPLFTLQPGMFDVILLVDIIETSGNGKRKKEMAENLMKIGVKMEVRKLQIGDFLWIAKEKFGIQREIVLDFVLERKRMDDLASSIIDGRFKEQKFRLKSCGLKKLIYLVEQYGSVEHFVVPEATLKQAIMNTQVVDGLFIKETNNIHDSVQYLRLMTNQIDKIYQDKTLHAVTIDDVKSLKSQVPFDDIILKKEQFLPRFEEFSVQSDKNKVLTVREIFAKQLMQFKGVSGERAVAIVDQYPSPTCYVEALKDLSDDEQLNLLTNIPFGKAKRKTHQLQLEARNKKSKATQRMKSLSLANKRENYSLEEEYEMNIHVDMATAKA